MSDVILQKWRNEWKKMEKKMEKIKWIVVIINITPQHHTTPMQSIHVQVQMLPDPPTTITWTLPSHNNSKTPKNTQKHPKTFPKEVSHDMIPHNKQQQPQETTPHTNKNISVFSFFFFSLVCAFIFILVFVFLFVYV